jgi:hypothetical protein
MSAGLRICGFGYQFFKPVRKYPLGLELYPRPYPRAQTRTRIRARRVWYPRVRGYFVPVAIPRDNEATLIDLTWVKQGRDEFVTDYFKRFKDIKNHCLRLSISKKGFGGFGFW